MGDKLKTQKTKPIHVLSLFFSFAPLPYLPFAIHIATPLLLRESQKRPFLQLAYTNTTFKQIYKNGPPKNMLVLVTSTSRSSMLGNEIFFCLFGEKIKAICNLFPQIMTSIRLCVWVTIHQFHFWSVFGLPINQFHLSYQEGFKQTKPKRIL